LYRSQFYHVMPNTVQAPLRGYFLYPTKKEPSNTKVVFSLPSISPCGYLALYKDIISFPCFPLYTKNRHELTPVTIFPKGFCYSPNSERLPK